MVKKKQIILLSQIKIAKFPRILQNYLNFNALFSKILVEKFHTLTCGNPVLTQFKNWNARSTLVQLI